MAVTEQFTRRNTGKPNNSVLLLNADGTPHTVASIRRAVYMLLDEKAFLVEEGQPPLRSPSSTFPRPLVIQLYKYHNSRFKRGIPVTVRGVLNRDQHRCAYTGSRKRPGDCLGVATTMDHIVPKAKGGKNDWMNCVASCRRCNQRKGSKTLEEMGWHLDFQPYRPSGITSKILLRGAHPEWLKYLQ